MITRSRSLFLSFAGAIAATNSAPAQDIPKLPPNEWVLLHEEEDNAGGKEFAKAIFAENTSKLILWGTGGSKPARNVYARYELETFNPHEPAWLPAFPESKDWAADNYPPFRIYGQSGPDGLRWDEGPRLRVVSGNARFNRIQWWDFDGYRRPSPVLTFNQACWDSKRKRVLYQADGKMIALEPVTRQWADLETPNYPDTCRTLAWGMMAYDSGKDRVMLFGGGLATNPAGAAPTWLYDCEKNRWERPKLDTEPPPRCNGALVYDATTASFVLFGGYDMAAALNDTWIFDPKTDRWEKRTPKIAPPPMYAPAHAVLPGGKLLVCGNDARTIKMTHISTTTATKETWIYDIAANTWTPIHAGLELPGVRWMSADALPNSNVTLMVAFGPKRQTFALRYYPSFAPAELPGAPPDSIAWKYPEQKLSLEATPPPDPEAHAEFLENLPVNQFVDAEPPGLLISKTWSTATIDTDRSEVIYTGGGHSGYSGNDFARYSIAENRWTLDQPPRFPPYLERASGGCFGWSYGQLPFSQHTYLWYDYDPVSKCVLYLARPSLIDGIDVHNRGETFTYDAKTHGYASWAYDSAGRKSHPPSFGRSFKNPWHLAVKGTPEGIFVATDGNLHRGKIDPENGEVAWKQIDSDFPKPREPIQPKYHYEFQPLLHDTKRNRLIQLKGIEDRVDVFVRPLSDDGSWEQLETAGTASIGREAVYLEDDDTILWLENRRLFFFDCAKNRMGEIDVELPEGSYTHECAMVYDPKHDVCVALVPSRFTGPMQTLLFRFDGETAKFK